MLTCRWSSSVVIQLSILDFTEAAQKVVLIGGPGTGKTHLATAIGVTGIAAKVKRMCFYSTVDLVNELENEKREGKAGGALLFHLLSKLYEHTRVVIRVWLIDDSAIYLLSQ